MPTIAKRLLIAVVVLALTVPLGTYAYIHFIREDAPARLTFDNTTTTAPTSDATPPPMLSESLNGTWFATTGSQVGYRVKELLFGQETEAVGRTSAVTGTLKYENQRVTDAVLAVDLTTIRSDQSNRDTLFRDRIMDTNRFPTATFRLGNAIQLTSPPKPEPQTVSATGELTLRGTTKPVTFDLQIREHNGNIEAIGAVPIKFDEWGIPNPSLGPAETEDHGELELLVVLAKQ